MMKRMDDFIKKITFSENAPKEMEPKRLIQESQDDKIENFFLVMGLFYNDLKSLTFHMVQTDKNFEGVNDTEISSRRGERGGIKTHLEKLTMATIYEFLRFIRENKKILETGEFQLIYKKLNQDLQNRWDMIVSISTKNKLEEKNSTFGEMLLLIRKILESARNNLAFHYYQSAKILKDGFIKHFYKDQKQPGNEKAYYDISDKMESTRFYYCDAAVQRAVRNEIEKRMDYMTFKKNFSITVDNLNFTIMFLMKEYLERRPYR